MELFLKEVQAHHKANLPFLCYTVREDEKTEIVHVENAQETKDAIDAGFFKFEVKFGTDINSNTASRSVCITFVSVRDPPTPISPTLTWTHPNVRIPDRMSSPLYL